MPFKWLKELIEIHRGFPSVPKAGWRGALNKDEEQARQDQAYERGLAVGEMLGRERLADEIELEFGIEGGCKRMGVEDAKLVRTKLVH